jgi:HSP20 family protein
MAAKTKKKTDKKSDRQAEDSEAATPASGQAQVAERPEVVEPFGWMNTWFDDWPRLFRSRFPEPFLRMQPGIETIRVEQYADGNEVVIRAELPGIDPEEAIDVSVAGDELTISATREQREESKTDDGFRSEFHYGSFRRVMTLPPGTAAEDIKASYDEGILEVRIPIGEAVTTKTKVPVERRA